jgi:hypothetical protein
VGAALGLGLATFGLLEDREGSKELPSETAAIVGERSIRRVDYERVLAGVEGDLRNPIDETMRRRVLDRMIDEELLVQRALALGLADIDRRVRGELTSGLMDSIVNEADGQEMSDRQIARHYKENLDFFTRPGRLRGHTLFFSARKGDQDPRGSAASRAERALVRLRGGDSEQAVEKELADSQVSPLPDTLLPASKVRDYVGPTILQVLLKTETGFWSEPIQSGSGLTIAMPQDRDPAIVPSLEEIESLVRQDLKRRRGDEALRQYLAELKSQTPVAINPELFDEPES